MHYVRLSGKTATLSITPTNFQRGQACVAFGTAQSHVVLRLEREYRDYHLKPKFLLYFRVSELLLLSRVKQLNGFD